jgi:phosphoglycolate phosphatase
MIYRAVIFDLDGTLLDSSIDIFNALTKAFNSNGLPAIGYSTVKSLLGIGIEELIGNLFPNLKSDPKRIGEIVSDYRRYYEQDWKAESKPYDGVVQLLKELMSKRIPLAILTNKLETSAHQVVSHFFSAACFLEIVGSNTSRKPKPDPEGAHLIASRLGVLPESVLFVGDTEVDVLTANRAGMHAVGVLWGFRSEQILRDSGAKTLAHHPLDILKCFDSTGTVGP